MFLRAWNMPNDGNIPISGLVLLLGKYTPREKICEIVNLKLNNGFQIYVNGSHKVRCITDKLGKKIQIVDLELVACPSIEELQDDLRIANTIELQQVDDCVPRKTYLYKNWILSQKSLERFEVGKFSKMLYSLRRLCF